MAMSDWIRGFARPRAAQDAVPASPPGAMRLRTLVLLRWLAINGQTAAILFVRFQLDFELPVWPCLAVIGASIWFNLMLSLRFPSTKRLTDTESAFYLGFDIVQLALLLMFTGGLENPFALLLLAPVTIAASTLHLRSTLVLMSLALVCGTFLAVWHWPVPWIEGGTLELPRLYVVGQWTALALGLAFMTTYAARIAVESRRLSDALAAGQMALAREQRLSALGGLAAAAAHELGTPLATISVIAKEMTREIPADHALAEDVSLLMSEANRCRDILGRLSRDPDEQDDVFKNVPLGTLLQEIADAQQTPLVRVEVDAAPMSGQADGEDAADPVMPRLPEIVHGLGNFIQNAVDFAHRRVAVQARWDGQIVRVTIEDDGPGFLPDIRDRLGDPYVTSRPHHYAANDGESGGMGLGIFIAKTLLERTGARLTFDNVKAPASGARVTVEWRRQELAAGLSFWAS